MLVIGRPLLFRIPGGQTDCFHPRSCVYIAQCFVCNLYLAVRISEYAQRAAFVRASEEITLAKLLASMGRVITYAHSKLNGLGLTGTFKNTNSL